MGLSLAGVERIGCVVYVAGLSSFVLFGTTYKPNKKYSYDGGNCDHHPVGFADTKGTA